jgi:hypothetical protein
VHLGKPLAFQRGIGADNDNLARSFRKKFLRELGEAEPVHAPAAPAEFQDRTHAHRLARVGVYPINGIAKQAHGVTISQRGFEKPAAMKPLHEDREAISGPGGVGIKIP